MVRALPPFELFVVLGVALVAMLGAIAAAAKVRRSDRVGRAMAEFHNADERLRYAAKLKWRRENVTDMFPLPPKPRLVPTPGATRGRWATLGAILVTIVSLALVVMAWQGFERYMADPTADRAPEWVGAPGDGIISQILGLTPEEAQAVRDHLWLVPVGVLVVLVLLLVLV